MSLNWQVFENRKAEFWMNLTSTVSIQIKKNVNLVRGGYFLGSTGVVCKCMLLWELEGNKHYIK